MWILNLEPKSNSQKALIFQGIFTFYILKGRFNMFGKKKKTNAIRVMHYEGIAQFATDYPCTIELIEYDKGMLAFWGAGFEAVKLWDIAKEFSSDAPSNISL